MDSNPWGTRTWKKGKQGCLEAMKAQLRKVYQKLNNSPLRPNQNQAQKFARLKKLCKQEENISFSPESHWQPLKQEYEHIEIASLAISETAWGDRRHYSLALYGGHDFQLHHSWRLHTGLMLGAATRHENVNSSLLHSSGIGQIENRGTTFSGSAKINVDYSFSDLCSAYVGYRFTYIPKLGDFDSLPIHQTELGLRWNL